MHILGYQCATAAGFGFEALMRALHEGRDTSIEGGDGLGRVCRLPAELRPQNSYREALGQGFGRLWRDIEAALPASVRTDLREKRVGLLFASTKGFIEDFVWLKDDIRGHEDPFNAVLEDFARTATEIRWDYRVNVSNACASSHVALEYAQELLHDQRLDYVLLLAGDITGDFVRKGFTALKLMSPTRSRPFSGARDGLQLGDALAAVLVARESAGAPVRLNFVASDTEGSSITRPSVNGQSLAFAMEKIRTATPLFAPDLVIAHGTGTRFNDQAEDSALHRFLPALGLAAVPITGLKWCVGHTLGASGAVDLIAGCEVLRRQKAFALANTAERDPALQMNYLTAQAAGPTSIRQVLINSLGFGGVHASLLLEANA